MDQPTIKNALNSPTPYIAGTNLYKLLTRHKNTSSSAIIIKMLPETSSLNEPSVIYLDQPLYRFSDRFKKYFQQVIIPFVKTGAQKTKSATKYIFKQSNEVYLPKIKKTFTNSKTKTVSTFKSGWGKAQPIIAQNTKKIGDKIDSAISGKKPDPSSFIKPKSNESIIGKSIYTIHDYQYKLDIRRSNPFKKIFLQLYIFVRRIPYYIRKILAQITNPKKRPLILTGIILLAIVILISSIAIKKNSQVNNQTIGEQQQILSDARQNIEDAKTALVFGDEQQAQIMFGKAISGSEKLINSQFDQEAKNILETAQKEFDKLTGTTRYNNVKEIASVSSKKFAVANNIIFSEESNGDIVSSPLENSQDKKVVGNLTNEHITSTRVIEGSVILFSDQKNMYEIKNNSLTKLSSTDPSLQSAQALDVFGDNIYTLDSAEKQIWKYKRTENNLAQKINYTPKSIDELKDAVDLTIDGAVYTISANGQVLKLAKGVKQEFSLSSIPKPFENITKASRIATNEKSNFIYVVDNAEHRILEFDKNGQFSHQFVLPLEFKDLDYAQIDVDAKKAYILNSGKIYQVEL